MCDCSKIQCESLKFEIWSGQAQQFNDLCF
jgi:hypothetical protein